MANPIQSLLADEPQDRSSSGYSSSEDFWMFFGMAMLLLVFVLMNYVRFLFSVPVQRERSEQAPEKLAEDKLETEPISAELRVCVEERGEGVYYYLDSDSQRKKLTLAQLKTRIEEWAEQQVNNAGATELTIKVSAPGTVLYQHVFNACDPGWRLQETFRDITVNVHLEYEEAN